MHASFPVGSVVGLCFAPGVFGTVARDTSSGLVAVNWPHGHAWHKPEELTRVDPAADYLGRLESLARQRPDLAEFIKRLAGSVRKLESLI